MANKVMFDPIRTEAFGAISNAFTALGTALEGPASAILFNNLTDAIIQISFNGTDVHMQLSATNSNGINFTDGGYSNSPLYMAANTQIYVRYIGAAPTVQSFWIEVMRPQLV